MFKDIEKQQIMVNKTLFNHENQRQTSKEKFLEDMRETRLVQNALQTVYFKEKMNLMRDDSDTRSLDKKAKVSQSIFANAED